MTGPVTGPERGLRWGLWAATAFGLATLVAAGLLPLVTAWATWGSAVIAGEVSSRAHSPALVRALRIIGLGMAGAVLAVTLTRGLTVQGLGNLGSSLSVALCALIVGQALAQRSRHDRLVALLLAGLAPVLAAGLAPGPRVMVPALACWLCLATTLAASHLLPAQLPRSDDPVAVTAPDAGGTVVTASAVGADRGADWSSVAAPLGAVVAASTAFGLVLFLLVPRPAGLAVLAAQGGDTATATRAVDNYSGQRSMDLRSQGSLPDDELFMVPGDAPPLWRGTVLTVYDDGVWGASSVNDGTSLGSGHVTVPRSVIDTATPDRPLRTDRVTVLPRAVSDFSLPPVIAPGRVVAVATTQVVTRQSGGGLALVPTTSDRFSYDATSVVQSTVATAVPAPGATWVEPDPQVWLQLPWNLPQRVVDLGHQLVDPAPSRAAAVAAVEDYLRAHEQYELNAPVATAAQDPVDYFLFDSHLGFCEHFASAEAVLLRSAGIPARVVTGFDVGAQSQPGDRTADGRVVVRANEAHAWVEVWMPGVGWATSDPTAGAVNATAPFDPLGAAGRWLQSVLLRPGERVTLALLIGAVTAFVVGFVAVVSRRRVRRRAVPVQPDRDPTVEPFAAFARLERRLVGVGSPRRPSETPVELLDRLPPAAGAALDVVERASYAAARPGPAEVAAASAALDDLAVGEQRC